MSIIVLPKLSYRLMSILFDIQNELGPSLLEKHYQRAIEEELENQRLNFEREKPVQITYKNKKLGIYYLDFVVENLIILEIKAQQYYSPKFFKQAYSYLKELNLPLAIIVNFRGNKIRYKRIVNPLFKDVDLQNKDEPFE